MNYKDKSDVMTPDEAIEIVARNVLASLVYTELPNEWENYPEIGELDWKLVYNQVLRLTPYPAPAAIFRQAYEFLEDRADRELS